MRQEFGVHLLSQAGLAAAGLTVSILAVELGASAWQVGVIGAAWAGAQLATSLLFGKAADAYGRRRLVVVGLALAMLAALAHLLARDPWTLVASRVAFGLAAGVFPPALTSLAFDHNRKLGRFSSFGSLGQALGVLAGGYVALVAHGAVFVLAAALLAGAFGLALLLRYSPDHPHHHVPVFPREDIERNVPVYAAVLIRHVGSTAAWVVFPLLLLDLGASLWWVGVASALNGLCQFVFMRLTDRYPPQPLVVAGLALSAVAFVIYAAAPNFWWLLAGQPVLAAGWAALYMGALRHCLVRAVERPAATGLLTSSVQLAAIVGPLVGGAVAQAVGYRGAMLLGVAGGLLAIPVFLLEERRHPETERERAEERVAAYLPGK